MSTLRFGLLVEQPPDEPEVLRGTADVGADERRPRMARDEPPERRQQLVERREPGRVALVGRPGRPEVPVRMGVQLLPALVRRVERLEERDRVGDVDDDRQVELGGGRPERVEPRVVDGDEAAVGIARPQSEQLPDLEPARAPRGGVPQPGRLGLAERRVGGPAVVVEAGEDRDPIRDRRPASARSRPRAPRPGRRRDRRASPRPTASSVAISSAGGRVAHSPPNAEPEVVVGVDDRELRPPDLVGRDAERRPRPEIGESEVVGASFRAEDDDLAEMARRVGVAAARQRQRERERVSRVDEQRQARRGMEPATDEAHLAASPRGPRPRPARSATSPPRDAPPPRRPRPPRAAPAPPTSPTTSMPGSQTEIGPWRNSSGS